jgi:hypothetical protein
MNELVALNAHPIQATFLLHDMKATPRACWISPPNVDMLGGVNLAISENRQLDCGATRFHCQAIAAFH